MGTVGVALSIIVLGPPSVQSYSMSLGGSFWQGRVAGGMGAVRRSSAATSISRQYMRVAQLADEERSKILAPLLGAEGGGWEMVQGRDAIQRKFEFENFVSAFGFMTRVALHAEKADHHPEW